MGAQESKPLMLEFPTTTHLYYAISRSFRRGSNDDGWPKRPSLPIEIILQIFDWAGFITRPPIVDLVATYNVPCTVSSFGSRVSETFMHTKPMTNIYLTRLRRLQVETISHDQGWVSHPSSGSWSWFEVVILSPKIIQDEEEESGMYSKYTFCASCCFDFDFVITGLTPKLYPGDPSRALVWHSHHNQMGRSSPSQRSGLVFTETHEIWDHLAEGDVIGVRACVQYPGWSNTVEAATLRLWERFDPTILG